MDRSGEVAATSLSRSGCRRPEAEVGVKSLGQKAFALDLVTGRGHKVGVLERDVSGAGADLLSRIGNLEDLFGYVGE